MRNALALVAVRNSGIAIVSVGLVLGAIAAQSDDSTLSRCYRQYTAVLDRRISSLFLTGSGRVVLSVQIVLILLAIGFSMLTRDGLAFGFALVIAFAPTVYLRRTWSLHVRKLEAQVDSLLTGLANALKTVPSPAAALAQVANVLPAPMRLEIDRLLKEMRLGSTLEQSLLGMSQRIKSPDLDTALSAVLIGLQVGGNLPVVLETTATAIREMNRLEGVVRAKTSEGRAQLWVLGLLPFVLCVAFTQLDQEYFLPMTSSIFGNLLIAIAVVLWVASLAAAYRILKVDL